VGPNLKNCGMEQDQAEVAAGQRSDIARVDIRATGEIVERADHIIDAHAQEGFADQFSTKLGEIEGAKDGRFGLFDAGRRRTRCEKKDDVPFLS
jgi:hypothetical protein